MKDWILHPEFCILFSEFWILDPEAWILKPESFVAARCIITLVGISFDQQLLYTTNRSTLTLTSLHIYHIIYLNQQFLIYKVRIKLWDRYYNILIMLNISHIRLYIFGLCICIIEYLVISRVGVIFWEFLWGNFTNL